MFNLNDNGETNWTEVYLLIWRVLNVIWNNTDGHIRRLIGLIAEFHHRCGGYVYVCGEIR